MYDAVIFTENTDPMQIAIPLGGFKVASVLRQNGYSTLVVNHLSTFTREEFINLLELVVTDQLKLIGFSTTFLKHVETINDETVYSRIGLDTVFPQGKDFENEMVSLVKYKNPNVKFIVGGAWTSPEYRNTNIDYVFMGYSETSIIDLMNHLCFNKELPNSTLNDVGITIIDDRKAPNYNFTEDRMVWQKTDVLNHRVLPIEIGRGCIFKCKFCSFPLNGKKSLDYIKHPDLIHDELLVNYNEFGITHYFIVDDTFNDHIDKLRSIEEVVKKLPFQPKFWCYTRLDLLCTKPEMVESMYNLGVRGMFFGIETLNKESGRAIGKGYDRDKQIAMIRHIRETYPDVSMHGSFIVGLPNESMDSLTLTCEQLMNGEIPLHSWMMKPLFIFGESTISFTSDMNMNYPKYGYRSNGVGAHNLIHWENDHITFEDAGVLADNCIRVSRTKDFFNVPSHDSFELVNFGYDLKTTMSTAFKDFRWDIVKDHVVSDFVMEYKNQLFKTLNAQVVELVDTQR